MRLLLSVVGVIGMMMLGGCQTTPKPAPAPDHGVVAPPGKDLCAEFKIYDPVVDPPTGNVRRITGRNDVGETIDFTALLSGAYDVDNTTGIITVQAGGMATATGMKPIVRTPRVRGGTPRIRWKDKLEDVMHVVGGKTFDWIELDSTVPPSLFGAAYTLCVPDHKKDDGTIAYALVQLLPGDAILVKDESHVLLPKFRDVLARTIKPGSRKMSSGAQETSAGIMSRAKAECLGHAPDYSVAGGTFEKLDGDPKHLHAKGTAKKPSGDEVIDYEAWLDTTDYTLDTSQMAIQLNSTGYAQASGLKPIIRTVRVRGGNPLVDMLTGRAAVDKQTHSKTTSPADTVTVYAEDDADYLWFNSTDTNRTYDVWACVNGALVQKTLKPGQGVKADGKDVIVLP